ncbi:DUF916 and DUF3324 domain-containing protein [Enterococcus canintestini]|uniref:Uncharacterized protein n=1 Tax=Enterococcus canintestini TaxID=317010 RepID=A0A267HPK0_9ENTE|nr:DUF916 and DUF3324 domain-containing protein [Enterococcus canintestini]PAB00291.1 hypothetical protein AKL21_09890 [Enterococcus canintestini]
MKKWCVLFTVLLASLSTLVSVSSVHAAENSAPAQDIQFIAHAQLPKNQVSTNVSYFDLQMEPKQEQTVHVDVTNTSAKKVTLETSFHQGSTNSAGVIEYKQTPTSVNQDPNKSIEKIVTVREKEITLAPKESKDIPIHIVMPKAALKGIQIGAIRLLQKNTETTKGNIQNQFAREIGVVLQSSDPAKIPSQLTLSHAKADQINARNVVVEQIENAQPKLIALKNIKATVTKAGSTKVLYQAKQTQASVAPNSAMSYPISLNGDAFKPGKYVATFEAKEGTHTWKLTKNFTVKAATSKNLNATDVLVQSKPSFFQQYKWIVLGGIFLLVVIVGLIGNTLRLKKKMN